MQGSDTTRNPQSLSDRDLLGKFSKDLERHLSHHQITEVETFLLKWKDLFRLHDLDLGHTTLATHTINLTDNTPFKERFWRIPPSMIDEVRTHIKEMLDLGVIEPSKSPYSSGVVLVRKKDGSLRFCIDLRKLNAVTMKDAYALPRIDESMDSLAGACWFSSLDLLSGYWQLDIAEEDRHKTAFTVGSLGFYQCVRMPFGCMNAPATFQHLMESCMGDLYFRYCLLYLDDIIVFSRTYEEHLEWLEAVFSRLKEAGLKLKPSKCSFFQRELKYLEHIISKDGVRIDPEKIRVIQDWPVPKNVKELQSFLGFARFYHRFVQGFSKIAKPLHALTQGSAGKT